MRKIKYNQLENSFSLAPLFFAVFDGKNPSYKLEHFSSVSPYPNVEAENPYLCLNIKPISNQQIVDTKIFNKKFCEEITAYINIFVKGEKTLSNSGLSFKKIQLADSLAGIALGVAHSAKENEIEMVEITSAAERETEARLKWIEDQVNQLYEKCKELDSIEINGRVYPSGRLGQILISLCCRLRSSFKERYEWDVRAQEQPAHIQIRWC